MSAIEAGRRKVEVGDRIMIVKALNIEPEVLFRRALLLALLFNREGESYGHTAVQTRLVQQRRNTL